MIIHIENETSPLQGKKKSLISEIEGLFIIINEYSNMIYM